jgi:hypothetical protein
MAVDPQKREEMEKHIKTMQDCLAAGTSPADCRKEFKKRVQEVFSTPCSTCYFNYCECLRKNPGDPGGKCLDKMHECEASCV